VAESKFQARHHLLLRLTRHSRRNLNPATIFRFPWKQPSRMRPTSWRASGCWANCWVTLSSARMAGGLMNSRLALSLSSIGLV